MELLLVLAKAKEAATTQGWVPALPQQWPAQKDLLGWCQTMGPGEACMLVILGIICILFGYTIFKGIVTLNAMLAGAWLGGLLGRSGNSAMAGAFVGAVVAAAITLPLMKHAVTIMGGLFGAVVGASLWRQAELQPDLAWAGALSGLILFGMLTLIVFRGSIIVFTSLQGAVMLVFGVLSLAYKYQQVAPDITDFFNKRAFFLPVAVMLPTIFGLLYQQAMCPPATAPAAKK